MHCYPPPLAGYLYYTYFPLYWVVLFQRLLKVIAHSRKVRNLFIQRIPYKPPIRHIHADFFQHSAQRTNPIDVLNKHCFEHHYGIYAGATVIFTVQLADKLIYLIEINRYIYLTQQMICWHYLLQTYKFDLLAILNIFCKHLHHPCLAYHIFLHFTRKRPPMVTFFDKLTRLSLDRRVSS